MCTPVKMTINSHKTYDSAIKIAKNMFRLTDGFVIMFGIIISALSDMV